MKIDINELTFLVLNADHIASLHTFECSNAELRAYLDENAYDDQIQRVSVTRLVFYQGTLVGYFTLVTDVIAKKDLCDGDGAPGYPYGSYPALKIARLATHQDYQGKNIGRNILMKIFSIWIRLSNYIGCRIITVDAKPAAVEFYKKFAFNEVTIDPHKLKNRETIPLYIDIRKELDGIDRDRTLQEFEE